MADRDRQPQPGVTGAPPAPEMDFFELLRTLEAEGGRFGGAGRPDGEPARLGQEVRLGFAVRDVARHVPAQGNTPAKVTVGLFGLLGPEGPMPLNLTRRVLDRLSQRWFSGGVEGATSDTTFLDFADMLQHRMTALFYRAWADQRPEVQAERPDAGRTGSMLGALVGGGSEAIGAVKRSQAASLARQVLGPERLTFLVRALLEVPVRVEEFVGTSVLLPARLQSRLGGPHAGLGRGATLGPRVFGRQSRIELRLGPLGLDDFVALLPGGERLRLLRSAVLHAIGETLDVDVRLLLRREEIPAARLGAARLGHAAWVAPRREADAADLRLGAVVGLASEGARAAA
jgi:type VI secretion system protein ImpH